MQIVSKSLLNILTLWNPKVSAMALWPFIIYKEKSCKINRVIYNHEKIHHRQQLELFILPFYILYFIEYWWHMFQNKFNHHKSYMKISFEKEAFENENNLKYLSERPRFAVLNYLK